MNTQLEQIRYEIQTMLNQIHEINQLAIEELKDITRIVVETRHSVFPDMQERLENIIKTIDQINNTKKGNVDDWLKLLQD